MSYEGQGALKNTQHKKGRSLVNQRRETIARRLRQQGRLSVSELAEQLGISPLTVRRDLDVLVSQGIATRRYGEALLAEEGACSPDTRLERTRRAIAYKAAELVRDRDSLFINTSATALGAIPLISAHDVTVITNSGRALGLAASPSMTMLITGGEIRAPRSVMSGEFALNNVRMVSPVRCFLGCAGITASTGITSLTLQEATVNSLMIERSEQHVLLMDSTKFGVEAGFRYASASDIDVLITDVNASEEVLRNLKDAGVGEILTVDPDEELTDTERASRTSS